VEGTENHIKSYFPLPKERDRPVAFLTNATIFIWANTYCGVFAPP
jgi:hypothetical protein